MTDDKPEGWTNPYTGMTHYLDQRVVWPYGRKNYAPYGEMGTVVGLDVTTEDGSEHTLAVQMDLPRNKKDINSGRLMHFSSDRLLTAKQACEEAAENLRNAASTYEASAARYDEYSILIPQEPQGGPE